MKKVTLVGSLTIGLLFALAHCDGGSSTGDPAGLLGGDSGSSPAADGASSTPSSKDGSTPTSDASRPLDGAVPDRDGGPAVDAADGSSSVAPPTANDLTLTTQEDTSVAGVLTGGDSAGRPLQMTVVAQPQRGTLQSFDPKTGAFEYMPNPNAHGQDVFTFRVNNGLASSEVATVTINVAPVADPPVAISQFLHVPKNGSVSFQLGAINVDGDPVTFASQAPAHGVVAGTAPSLTYTPTADYVGNDTFTFTASNAAGASTPAGTVKLAIGKPEVHLLSVYGGTGSQINVNVDTGGEVVLYVSAFEATKWSFTVAAGTTVKKVVWDNAIRDTYTYYGGAQTFTGLPPETTVVNGSHYVTYEPTKLRAAVAEAERAEGTPVTGVHAAYETSSFQIRTRPGGGGASDPELHYINDYGGGGTVNIERTKPVILVLSSYSGGGWTINPVNGTKVMKVVMCSYSLSTVSMMAGGGDRVPASYAMYCGGYSFNQAASAAAGFVDGAANMPYFAHGASRTITRD